MRHDIRHLIFVVAAILALPILLPAIVAIGAGWVKLSKRHNREKRKAERRLHPRIVAASERRKVK